MTDYDYVEAYIYMIIIVFTQFVARGLGNYVAAARSARYSEKRSRLHYFRHRYNRFYKTKYRARKAPFAFYGSSDNR